MTRLNISPEEQTKIFLTIDGLPPTFLLPTLNQQQTQHWLNIREFFDCLNQTLKAFLSGQANPLTHLPAYEQELLAGMADSYLKLYGVIQWGWEDILNAFAEYHTNHYSEKFPWDTPGETLAAILERDAAARFCQCKLGRHEFKPRKMYSLHRNAKKFTSGELSKAQQQKYRNDAKALTKDFESLMELEIFCINACRLAAKSRNDKVLKRKIAEYEQYRDELSKVIYRDYRNSTGYAWQSGELLKTKKEGGTYS
ncbi:MAG: hypothetical protein ACYTX0_31745 [Nostoc sp.]